ncbi:uncharacterized protein B0I36DRAFT_146072 [Microdochium trichocladiopsis]|uniref:Archaemetzincin-2 n=1 Tax=Microdochium trichocladiopsis TaxID=1682393 RepID=A0A9P8Y2N2_9PEZI|nr:uncharacterized protein B0I36DRAFT_146072 [Microdochium trichocladiopsis]KAH7027991.1 hypothetical protein B0I36DRAFT_146072 [Microdochium trichocladiopsis]
MPKQPRACQHTTLQLEPSACAARVGFTPTAATELLAAAELSGETHHDGVVGTAEAVVKELSAFFPAPLILPGDELAYEPTEEGQSCHEWLHETERNQPMAKRGTLYVASVPRIDPEVKHVETWTRPGAAAARKTPPGDASLLQPPQAEDIIDFLSAFYHGVPVKPFPQQLRFVAWDGETDREDVRNGMSYIGLATTRDNNCTRIRARTSPDGEVFPKQLNLEDILDAGIEMLPGDAYALLLLVDHDLYESDEDDFCCGRAYGGSRVCVVQTARYHPALDAHAGIDAAHMWPTSHCKTYLDKLCRAEGISVASGGGRGSAAAAAAGGSSSSSSSSKPPLRAAVDAAVQAAQGSLTGKTSTVATTSGSGTPAAGAVSQADQEAMGRPSPAQRQRQQQQQGLWLSRLARTTAHELGHCFGMDHCVYYACLMQSTASMAEDVRQPPYLCPVCLNKVAHAVAGELLPGTRGGKMRKMQQPQKKKAATTRGGSRDVLRAAEAPETTDYLIQRYAAIADFCGKWAPHVGMFAGYRAWALARIDSLQGGSSRRSPEGPEGRQVIIILDD